MYKKKRRIQNDLTFMSWATRQVQLSFSKMERVGGGDLVFCKVIWLASAFLPDIPPLHPPDTETKDLLPHEYPRLQRSDLRSLGFLGCLLGRSGDWGMHWRREVFVNIERIKHFIARNFVPTFVIPHFYSAYFLASLVDMSSHLVELFWLTFALYSRSFTLFFSKHDYY